MGVNITKSSVNGLLWLSARNNANHKARVREEKGKAVASGHECRDRPFRWNLSREKVLY